MADKVQQEVSQTMNSINSPEDHPNDASAPPEVVADYVPEESKDISEIESLPHFETPLVPESSPDDRGVGGHSPAAYPPPVSVPLKPYIETLSRLDDPVVDHANVLKLPTYPVFTATPLTIQEECLLRA